MAEFEAVRKSIARISFKCPRTTQDNKKEIVTVVLCGTIVSIKDDGSCLVIADPTFFRQENCPFVVNLPTAEGYDAVPVAPSAQFLEGYFHYFCGLVLKANDYVRPVTIETRLVRTCDDVYGFYFPRKDYFTPAGYSPGSVVRGDEDQQSKFYIGIPFHSCAHFGSPIFNQRGHFVGISLTPMDAQSVRFLQKTVFKEAKIKSLLGSVSYVLNGNPIPPEGPVLPDGQVPPI